MLSRLELGDWYLIFTTIFGLLSLGSLFVMVIAWRQEEHVTAMWAERVLAIAFLGVVVFAILSVTWDHEDLLFNAFN
jgi:hypothetical protein